MGITLKNNKSVTKNMTIKGDNGVGIKTITSGTPVVTEEKTTTPITVTLTDETTQNFNVEAKNGSGADNALTKPTTAPSATQIVAVDNTNTQTMLNIGDGLSVENGSLKASGGTGTKKYFHQIAIYDRLEQSELYFNLVTTTPSFNNALDVLNEIPNDTYIPYAQRGSKDELIYIPIVAQKVNNEFFGTSVDINLKKAVTFKLEIGIFSLDYDHSVEL